MDLSTDYQAWDNVEAVVWSSSRTAGVLPATVPIAKRRAVRGREKSPSGGVYAGYELDWHLPAAVLSPGATPKPGDGITDSDGTLWTVLTVDLNRWRQTWKLGAVNLVLALDLRDLVTVERAAVTYGAAGAAAKRFPSDLPSGGQILYASVPARVQLLTAAIAEERGIRYSEGSYHAIVGQQLTNLDPAEDRFLWTDPAGVQRVLDLISYQNPQRIDELPWVEAKLKA